MKNYHLSVQNHRDMHDAGFTELICPHGIGHHKGRHGCDGCCSEDKRPEDLWANVSEDADDKPNTRCTSACGNDYDCPHEEEGDPESYGKITHHEGQL